jgi:hypothetical protein
MTGHHLKPDIRGNRTLTDRLIMIKVTYLPLFVTRLLRGMPGMWKDRHRLILCWLVVMQALFPGRKTLAELARWTPSQITAWRFRRLLNAVYWDLHVVVEWWVQEALNTLPPPQDGILYLVGDGREKPKRGKKHPLAQKGRKGANKPWFFGVRFALLMVNWDVYRLPVAFRPIHPKTHPQSRKEHDLFCDMVTGFVPPLWAHTVIVEGDAGYGSQDNMKMVMKRDQPDTERRWGFVFAMARTWKTVEDKAIKDLVRHVPRKYSKRTWIPGLPGARGRKTFWMYSKRLCLRHVGDVTGVLSQKGRNLGPHKTKILVTNLPELTPSQVVCCSQRRWPVEQVNRELQSDLGLGEHQVSGEEDRMEKSFGIAVMAYLFLVRACHKEIIPGQSWSVPQLRSAFRLQVITNQVAHHVKSKLAKVRKAA